MSESAVGGQGISEIDHSAGAATSDVVLELRRISRSFKVAGGSYGSARY